MTSGLLNSPLLLTAIGDYQTETSAWITRTEAAGGTISTATKNAVDAFVVSCKGAGIWTKFKRLNLFCGNNLTACLSPLVNTYGGNMDTNYNSSFVSGDYAESTGLHGGSGKSLTTGFIPNTTLAYNYWHMASYMVSPTAGAGIDLGCVGHPSGNIQWRILSYYFLNSFQGSGVIAGDYSGGSNPTFQTYGNLVAGGLFLASRTSSSAMLARNTSGSVSYSNSASYSGIQALPTAEVCVMADGAGGYEAVSHHIGGYSVGLGMDSAQMASYCSIMETFQTALSRNHG